MYHFNLLPCMFTENEIQWLININYPIVSMAAIWRIRPIWFKLYSKFWNIKWKEWFSQE